MYVNGGETTLSSLPGMDGQICRNGYCRTEKYDKIVKEVNVFLCDKSGFARTVFNLDSAF